MNPYFVTIMLPELLPPLRRTPAQQAQQLAWSNQSLLYRTTGSATGSVVQAAKRAIIEAIGDDLATQVIADASGNTRSVPPQQYFMRLHAHLNSFTDEDFATNRNTLREPFVPPASFSIHVSKHVTAAAFATAAGCPVSDMDRVALFMDSLKPCGIFKSALDFYKAKYPSPAQKSFATLTAAMLAHYESLVEPTAAEAGFAHATTLLPPAPTATSLSSLIDAKLDARFEQLLAKVTSLSTRHRSTASGGGAGAGRGSRPRPPSAPTATVNWCYTHGYPFQPPGHPTRPGHTSMECHNPSADHVWEATAANPRGSKHAPKRA